MQVRSPEAHHQKRAPSFEWAPALELSQVCVLGLAVLQPTVSAAVRVEDLRQSVVHFRGPLSAHAARSAQRLQDALEDQHRHQCWQGAGWARIGLCAPLGADSFALRQQRPPDLDPREHVLPFKRSSASSFLGLHRGVVCVPEVTEKVHQHYVCFALSFQDSGPSSCLFACTCASLQRCGLPRCRNGSHNSIWLMLCDAQVSGMDPCPFQVHHTLQLMGGEDALLCCRAPAWQART